MKKINLMDIMESLSSDNMEDAQAALHEWFVDAARQVQSGLEGQVTEDEGDDSSSHDETLKAALANAIEFIDGEIAIARENIEVGDEEEDNSDHEVLEALLSIKEQLESGGVTSDEVENWGNEIYNATMGPAGYGDTDYSDYISNELKGILGFDDEDDIEEAVLESEETEVEVVEESTDETVEESDEVVEAAEETVEEDEEKVDESVDDLIAELHEAFAGLEKVSDKLQNVEGAQVGEEGKVPVNKKGTLPSKKGDKRVGGEPVEIKADEHKGFALEKAPKAKDAPVKHHVQNSKDDPKEVKADKSALLNKSEGKGNTESPISGKGAKGLKK